MVERINRRDEIRRCVVDVKRNIVVCVPIATRLLAKCNTRFCGAILSYNTRHVLPYEYFVLPVTIKEALDVPKTIFFQVAATGAFTGVTIFFVSR